MNYETNEASQPVGTAVGVSVGAPTSEAQRGSI